jgi:hypothetical protein
MPPEATLGALHTTRRVIEQSSSWRVDATRNPGMKAVEAKNAMMSGETQTSRLSFFGRIADDLTRKVLPATDMTVFLAEGREALIKADGHFAFADLEPSPTDYRIHIGARSYQDRIILQGLPTSAPVRVMLPGEDELYLLINNVAPPQQRVTFEPITFVASIEAGAAVIGEGGFIATLAEALEGQKITFAVLSTVAGLAAGQVLRIVRSSNLLLRPRSYYSFPADATVIAVKVVANDSLQTALGDVDIEITRINGTEPTLTDVGGLQLNLFDLGANPPGSVILDDNDKNTATNDRGDAVFYFPGSKQITSIQVGVTKTGFQASTSSISVTAKRRNSQNIALAAL